jgi:diguanylate cyclase (GGDEF)-like protein
MKRFWESGESHPDVFICANDYMAMGAIEALAERGLRVPEGVAITGFDDVPVFKHYEGSLSTVRQPVRELCRRAVAALAESLEGRPVPVEGRRLSTEAVIRSTCGCRLGAGRWIGAPHPLLSGGRWVPGEKEAGAPFGAERLAELLLQMESSESIALQRLDVWIDQSISSFCKAYIRDLSLEEHQAKEAALLEALRARDFYVVLLPGPQPGIAGEARLALAWSGGERIPLPPGSFAFPARDILLAAIMAGRRCSLMAMGLADGQARFGICFLSPGARRTNGFEKLGARLAKSMRAVRSAREFKELSDKLKETSAKLEELSLSDELTGLYNRRGLLTFAAQQITYCRRQCQAFAILYMDLDGLKEINDTWGHESGDDALRAMAELRMKAFRSSDIVSRIGGDEFCVLAPNTAARRSDSILERLSSLLRSFNTDGAQPCTLSMSVGEFHSDPADTSPIEVMMREADARLYEEKKKKRAAPAADSPEKPR